VKELQAGLLVLLALGGLGVVLMRDPLRQALMVGIYGLLLALLFFVLQAPDVALSQIVVSTVAVPVMILLAPRRSAATNRTPPMRRARMSREGAWL
jgi:energy-converting hydrogenase B subunit D